VVLQPLGLVAADPGQVFRDLGEIDLGDRKRPDRLILQDGDVELPALDVFLDQGRLFVHLQDAADLDGQGLRVVDHGIRPDPQARVLGVGLDDDREADLERLVDGRYELAGRGRQSVGAQDGLGHVLVLTDRQGPGVVPGERQVHQLERGGHVGFPLRPSVEALAEVDQDVDVQFLDPPDELDETPLERDDADRVAELPDRSVDLPGDLGDGLLRELFRGTAGDRFEGIEGNAHVELGLGHHCISTVGWVSPSARRPGEGFSP